MGEATQGWEPGEGARALRMHQSVFIGDTYPTPYFDFCTLPLRVLAALYCLLAFSVFSYFLCPYFQVPSLFSFVDVILFCFHLLFLLSPTFPFSVNSVPPSLQNTLCPNIHFLCGYLTSVSCRAWIRSQSAWFCHHFAEWLVKPLPCTLVSPTLKNKKNRLDYICITYSTHLGAFPFLGCQP